MKKISFLLCIIITVFLFISWNKVEKSSNYDHKNLNKENEYKLIMINEELYYNTEKESTNIPRCGTLDGEITCRVDQDKIPKENDQSNFGKGYGYQIGED